MKYPSLPRDLKRNIKVTTSVLEEARRLRMDGLSLRGIAKDLSLSYTTVQRYLQSSEKRQKEILKKREYNRKYQADGRRKEENKENRNKAMRENRAYRKTILGKDELAYKSFANTKNRYKGSNGESLLKVMDWHKNQIANLIEIEPLLILFRSKNDRIKVSL